MTEPVKDQTKQPVKCELLSECRYASVFKQGLIMLMRFMSNRMVIDTADTLIVGNRYYIGVEDCGIAHP